MSGSRFWAKNSDPRPESEKADGIAAGTLTAMDRCDRCGAQAYVRVVLPSRLELLFCAHHNRQYASALTEIAVEIRDETHRLARVAAQLRLKPDAKALVRSLPRFYQAERSLAHALRRLLAARADRLHEG